MRPLVCYSATRLDGHIAGPAGKIDWLFTSLVIRNKNHCG